MQTAELVTFQSISVILAFAGMGAWSFIIALLLSEIVSAIVVLMMSPFKPGLHLDSMQLKQRLKFGIPLQGASILNCIRMWTESVILGADSGPSSVGLVGFATQFATYPVSIVSQIAGILFPLFSSIKHDATNLPLALGQALRWCCLTIFGLISIMGPLAPYLIPLVFGSKWVPTVPLDLSSSTFRRLHSNQHSTDKSGKRTGLFWTSFTFTDR